VTQQNPENDPAVDTSKEVKTADEAAVLPTAEAVTTAEPEASVPEPEAVVVPEVAAPEPEDTVHDEVASPEPEDTVHDEVIAPEEVAATEPEVTVPSIPTPASIHVPSPAALAGRLHGNATAKPSEHGRVDESGTVFVRTPDGEREVGSYPGASPAEALSYFTRKYDELVAAADLLLQRVTHTDLPARDGSEGLAKLREQTTEAHVVGDLAALDARIAQIAAAVGGQEIQRGGRAQRGP